MSADVAQTFLREPAGLLHIGLQVAWRELSAVQVEPTPEVDQLLLARTEYPPGATARRALADWQRNIDAWSLNAHDRARSRTRGRRPSRARVAVRQSSRP